MWSGARLTTNDQRWMGVLTGTDRQVGGSGRAQGGGPDPRGPEIDAAAVDTAVEDDFLDRYVS